MKPIQEFSDDDLINELMERYDDIVIGARRILTRQDNPKSERRRWWKGDLDACVGLIQSVSSDLINEIWKERKVLYDECGDERDDRDED